jgi:hypothetical protein
VTTSIIKLSKPIEPIVSMPLDQGFGKRREAKPIKRILNRKTLECIGWLYEWNTGELLPMWTSEPCKDIIYD